MQSESHKNWLTELAHRYHEDLTDEVRSYLASRALDEDAVNGGLLGLVSDPDPAHEQYRDRLALPFITPTGVVAIRFRCMEDHRCNDLGHGKYESPAGESTHLYNVQAIHDATNEIGVSEGELDALAATYAGLPTVGCPGSNNWKPFFYRLFEDFEHVYLLGDGDKAGRKWAAGLAPVIPGAVSRVMPNGYDVSSYIAEHNGATFLEYVQP